MYSDRLDQKTDEELVELALKEAEIFSYLIKRYEAKILNYIRKISNLSYEDAEDLLQEIFIKVYQNLNNFNSKYKFTTWLYRIAHNEVISHYRKLKSRIENYTIQVEESVVDNLADELDLVSEIDKRIQKELIMSYLNQLDRKYKDVLVLKYLEDKDYQEISFILKKPVGTIGTLINRGKKQLKNIILKSYDNR